MCVCVCDTRGVVVKVTCSNGGGFSLALSDRGDVYSWGYGQPRALGHGSDNSLATPRVIQSLEGKRIRDIGVGTNFSMALTFEGEVYVWGTMGSALGLGDCGHDPELYPRLNHLLAVRLLFPLLWRRQELWAHMNHGWH